MTIHKEAIDAVNEGKNIPRKIGDFKIEYVATDGWRGYYSAVATKKSGWKIVQDGWITGNWSDAGENASDNVEAELKRLDAKAISEGKELAVVFTPTSNVFSTSYDVFTRKIA